jgi:endonuclease YncB( thermonuclease family)
VNTHPVAFRMSRTVAAVTLALACLGAASSEILGVVVSVASGDRLVFDTGRERLRVTLARVTAPAGDTTVGARSRAALTQLCYGEAATLVITGTALDGATIGQVSCAGRDAAREQLRRGLARLNPPYEKLDSVLGTAELEARAEQTGIWAK